MLSRTLGDPNFDECRGDDLVDVLYGLLERLLGTGQVGFAHGQVSCSLFAIVVKYT